MLRAIHGRGRLLAMAFGATRPEPLPPGPKGRILFIGPFNGGIGGMERLARIFADWVGQSGYTATMVFRHAFPRGPFTIDDTEATRTLDEKRWNRDLERADWDFVYVMPSGLKWKRWVPRLPKLAGLKIVLDLDQARHWDGVADVLHCETPRDEPRALPCVVAPPDVRSTIPDGEPADDAGFTLTAFTPYGRVKGHHHIPAFLEATDKRLIWCFDPLTFAKRKKRYAKEIRARIEAVAHPRLELVEAPSQAHLYSLYRAADDYACFSERESFGFSFLDAVALGKPVCGRRIGAFRLLDGFEPTEDFAKPVFGTYTLPETLGYQGLFDAAREAAGARA